MEVLTTWHDGPLASAVLLHGRPGDHADSEELIDGKPDAVRAYLPDAGHFSPLEAPEAWAEAIRAAL